jgi:MscS family membrane protein
MESLVEWLKETWSINYVQAGAAILASFVVARIVDWLATGIFAALVRRTRTRLDDKILDLLHSPLRQTILIIGFGIAGWRLELSDALTGIFSRTLGFAALLVWTIFAFRSASLLLRSATDHPTRFRALEERTFPLFDNVFKITIAAAAAYFAFAIWDIDATGWIASAGIVGIAVGFAAKDTLSNLFAGVFIIVDAPYRVGDYIVLDSAERGQVVHIGIRSTRLLTRDNVEITIPNSVVGNAKVTNETGGTSTKKRIKISIGAAYGSDIDRVRQVLLDVAQAEPGACPEPEPRVRFVAFGESSLDFQLQCWVDRPDLDGRVADALNTAIYKQFAANEIEIPYPKRDLYIKEGAPTSA